jgi:Rrf2 family iron-sulfur cluster assembly transcriptional regulator
MFPISSKARYGLRALILMAKQGEQQPMSLTAIAREEGLSVKYLESIFSLLKRNNIVLSLRGSEGGYVLSRLPSEFSLYEIMHALEGPMDSVDCKFNICENSQDCMSRKFWMDFEGHIKSFLDSRSLGDLVNPKLLKEAIK